MIQATKKTDYSNISNINELHSAQEENHMRMKQVQYTLSKNISSLRESLHIGNLFVKMCSGYLSIASHLHLYRQGFLWIRSLLFKNNNKNHKDGGKQDIIGEI